MKKLLLSLSVVLTFILYAFGIRPEGSDEAVAVTAPQNLTNSSYSSTSTSASPTTNSSHMPNSTMGSSHMSSQKYKDGQYTSPSIDVYYGNLQIKVTITNGKISDVNFLDYPQDRNTSVQINSQAMPYLKQEAMMAQSGQVDIVSGATRTSLGFQEAIQNVLNQASQA